MPDLATATPKIVPEPGTELVSDITLHGSVLVLLQFDVCEAIRLDRLRELLRASKMEQPALKHPGAVRYRRPPVVESIGTLTLESGEELQGEVKYYDYGVLSVVFELPFEGGWDKLTALASRWVWDVDFAAQATEIVRRRLEHATAALVKPYSKEWLSEDYLIFHIREITGAEITGSGITGSEMGGSPTVADLIHRCGPRIAQVVRGDT